MDPNAAVYMEGRVAQRSLAIYPWSHSCMAEQLSRNPVSLRQEHCPPSLAVPPALVTSGSCLHVSPAMTDWTFRLEPR